MRGADVQMSKRGWARLRKQQQQQQEENTLSQSDENEYQVHKYKNIISSKQKLPHMNATTFSSATRLPDLSIRGSILQVDQRDIKPSKLLQIVRRWKAQSTKQFTPARPHRPATSASSCSRLSLVPLSCINFSSIQLYSDHEEEEDDDDGIGVDNIMAPADHSHSPNAKIPAPLFHDEPRSAPEYTAQSSHRSESSCERKVQAVARRALSCPKLGSPLRSCTGFAGKQADEGGEEELERLQGKEGGDGSIKNLRRSISLSPLRGHSISKQSSIPKGYLALYVGEERRRFLVKANLVNHPLFSVLLEKAREEFGFDQKGPLNIPCEISFFQHILFLVESNHDPSSHLNSSLLQLPFPSAATVV